MSLLAIMGSGETAPTMVRTHRRLLDSTFGGGDGPAVMLDTTFGFQDNADDLVAKTRTYFHDAVGRDIEVATWRRADTDALLAERSLALLHRARWAFAGPGSPTYALRQWQGTSIPAALVDVATRGGTLVLGSAAACTVGTHAVPVYEIYKAGADLYWEPGLDLLGALTGIHAAVIPHFDNNEGGSYDTRFCYLGAQRLARMEELLPNAVGVLGVDEHTAVVIDVEAQTVTVSGNGVMTAGRTGRMTEFEAGTELSLDDLAAALTGSAAPSTPKNAAARPPAGPVDGDGPGAESQGGYPSLRAEADGLRTEFEDALAARDVDGCVTAVLALEQSITMWRTDTLQGPDTDHARRALRAMIVRLGELAVEGARNPRDVVGPYVEALLALRAVARAHKDFATSDAVRRALTGAGVEVRDTRDGVIWELRPSDS